MTPADTSASAEADAVPAVDALTQELGYPARARHSVRHVLLSLVALTWFPQLHEDTLVRAIGFDASDARYATERKRHITTLLQAITIEQRVHTQ